MKVWAIVSYNGIEDICASQGVAHGVLQILGYSSDDPEKYQWAFDGAGECRGERLMWVEEHEVRE